MKVFKLQERITVALFLDNIYKNDDIADIWQFDQTWGSTALGFNGIGGSALTSALTSVVLKTVVSICLTPITQRKNPDLYEAAKVIKEKLGYIC